MDRGRGRGRFMRGDRGGRGRGGFRGNRVENPTKLHVTNIPEGCKKHELEQLFEEQGKVVECDIIRDFAFVHFRDAEDAQKAVENLHGHKWNGAVLAVRHSTSVLRQKPGAQPGDCFFCGGRGHSSTVCPSNPAMQQGGAGRDDGMRMGGGRGQGGGMNSGPMRRGYQSPYQSREAPYPKPAYPSVDPYSSAVRDAFYEPNDPFERDYRDPSMANSYGFQQDDSYNSGMASAAPYGRRGFQQQQADPYDSMDSRDALRDLLDTFLDSRARELAARDQYQQPDYYQQPRGRGSMRGARRGYGNVASSRAEFYEDSFPM